MSTINTIPKYVVSVANASNGLSSLEEYISNFNVLLHEQYVVNKYEVLEVTLQALSREDYLTPTGVLRARLPLNQAFIIGETGEYEKARRLRYLCLLSDNIGLFFKYLEDFTNGGTSSSVIRGLSSLLLDGD